MVKVLENVFRRIICSFAVKICGDTETRCLHYFRHPYLCYSEPYKLLLHIWKNNSAAENGTDVRLGQVVNLSIFYNI